MCAGWQSSVLLPRGKLTQFILCAVVKFYCPLWHAFLFNTHTLNSKYHSQKKYLNRRQLCQEADLGNGMQKAKPHYKQELQMLSCSSIWDRTHSILSNLLYSSHHPLWHKMRFSLLFINLLKKTLGQCVT